MSGGLSDPMADKILPILKLLDSTDLTERRIAELTDVAPTTVARYRSIQQQRGYTLAYLESLTPRELRRRFDHVRRWQVSRPIPNWPDVHRQMRLPGGNLVAIWEKDREEQPNIYSYPRFLAHYGAWEYELNFVGRQQRHAGEVAFVGVMDKPVPWTESGRKRSAWLYHGVLGCSGYSFVQAAADRSLPDWLSFHDAMFAKFGGAPAFLEQAYFQDTAGLERDLTFHEAYEDLAIRYGTHVTPIFPYGPASRRDVPAAVRLACTWIQRQLRGWQFRSIAQINIMLQPILARLNQKPFKRLPGCRASWFEEMDKPYLRPLPADPPGHDQGHVDAWARDIGPNASALLRLQLERYAGQKLLNTCEKLRHLASRFGDEDFELACRMARESGKTTVQRVRSLLKQITLQRRLSREGLAGDDLLKGDHHE